MKRLEKRGNHIRGGGSLGVFQECAALREKKEKGGQRKQTEGGVGPGQTSLKKTSKRSVPELSDKKRKNRGVNESATARDGEVIGCLQAKKTKREMIDTSQAKTAAGERARLLRCSAWGKKSKGRSKVTRGRCRCPHDWPENISKSQNEAGK